MAIWIEWIRIGNKTNKNVTKIFKRGWVCLKFPSATNQPSDWPTYLLTNQQPTKQQQTENRPIGCLTEQPTNHVTHWPTNLSANHPTSPSAIPLNHWSSKQQRKPIKDPILFKRFSHYCPRSSSSQSAELCLDNLLAKLAASCSEHYSWDFLFLCICGIPAWLLLPSSGQKILILMLHPSCLNFSFISWLYCPTKRFVLCTCVIKLQHGEIYSRLELKAISGSPLIFPNLLTLSLACLCFFFFCRIFNQFSKSELNICFKGSWKPCLLV